MWTPIFVHLPLCQSWSPVIMSFVSLRQAYIFQRNVTTQTFQQTKAWLTFLYITPHHVRLKKFLSFVFADLYEHRQGSMGAYYSTLVPSVKRSSAPIWKPSTRGVVIGVAKSRWISTAQCWCSGWKGQFRYALVTQRNYSYSHSTCLTAVHEVGDIVYFFLRQDLVFGHNIVAVGHSASVTAWSVLWYPD